MRHFLRGRDDTTTDDDEKQRSTEKEDEKSSALMPPQHQHAESVIECGPGGVSTPPDKPSDGTGAVYAPAPVSETSAAQDAMSASADRDQVNDENNININSPEQDQEERRSLLQDHGREEDCLLYTSPSPRDS